MNGCPDCPEYRGRIHALEQQMKQLCAEHGIVFDARAPSPSPGAPAEWMQECAEIISRLQDAEPMTADEIRLVISRHAPACDADKARLAAEHAKMLAALVSMAEHGYGDYATCDNDGRGCAACELAERTLTELGLLPAPPAAAKEGE